MGIAIKYDRSDRLWTVGLIDDESEDWTALRDCASSEEACAFVNYLNGGAGDPFDWTK